MHAGPEEHDCTPTWHMLPPGLHCEPAEHATQLPAPSHTPPVPPVAVHDVPADAGVPWSVHVATPPALHAVTLPMWHALPAGGHAAPTWQAVHAPPLQ